MKSGFIVGVPGATQLPLNAGQFPATIGWIDGPPKGRGPKDQLEAEFLAPVGVTLWNRDPRFPAWSCKTCHRVEFTYDNPVYTPDARVPSD